MTDDLQEALRHYAAPAEPPIGARKAILARVDRRRRRTAVVAAAAVAAVTVAGVGLTEYAVRDDAGTPTDPTSPRTSGRWAELPPSPLTARHGSVGVWTGEEMLVAGGTTERPCPPLAECLPIPHSSFRADGAAYDPSSETWRRIADAPARLEAKQAVWSGSEMIVITAAATYAYEPAADRWRTLPAAPRGPVGSAPAVVTDEGIVFTSYSQFRRGPSPDQVLDPATGTWSTLPRDPFGESYDRSLAWDGERLWLLSMAVEQHGPASEGSPSRLAVLEGGLADGTWRVVDDATPDLTYGQLAWWSDGRITVTAGSRQPARAYDVARAAWIEVGSASSEGCALPPAGVGPSWVAGGGPDLAPAEDGGRATVVPPCPSLPDPDVAVWADETLLLWGVPAEDYERGTTAGLAWTPPAPG